jgi:hypothetical protein
MDERKVMKKGVSHPSFMTRFKENRGRAVVAVAFMPVLTG